MASLVPKHVDDPIDRRVLESFEAVWPLVAAPLDDEFGEEMPQHVEELESAIRVLLAVWDPGTGFTLDPLAIFERVGRGRERAKSLVTLAEEENLVIALSSRMLGFAWLIQRRSPHCRMAGIGMSLALLVDLTWDLYLIDEFERSITIYEQLRELLPMSARSLEELVAFIVDAAFESEPAAARNSRAEAITAALPSSLVQAVTAAVESALALERVEEAQRFLDDTGWVDRRDPNADAPENLWRVWDSRSKVSMAAGHFGDALRHAQIAVSAAQTPEARSQAAAQLARAAQRRDGNFLEITNIPGISGDLATKITAMVHRVDAGHGESVESLVEEARPFFESMVEHFPEYERQDEYVLVRLMNSVGRPERLVLSEEQRRALKRLQRNEGKRAITALVFLMIDARENERAGLFQEILRRAKDELNPEDTFGLNHTLGYLIFSEGWALPEEQCLPRYIDWLDHVADSWESSEERGVADEVAQQLTLTVNGLLNTLMQLFTVIERKHRLSARALSLAPRLFRAVLGRPLRLEQSWRRPEPHRGGAHRPHLRAMERAVSRREWDTFDAERKQFLDAISMHRQSQRQTANQRSWCSSLPELFLAGYATPNNDSTLLLRFARFDGQPVAYPPSTINGLPREVIELVERVRATIRRPRREFDVPAADDGGLAPELLTQLEVTDREYDRAWLEFRLGILGAALLGGIEQPLPELFGVRAIGPLQSVPFAALRTDEGWVGERSLPIVLTGNDDPDQLLRPMEESPSILVVADPVFSGVRSCEVRDASQADTRGGLAPLPGTGIEAQAISRLFPEARVLTGRDATREGLLDALGSAPPQILHLATHGISDGTNPERSHLALSLDARGEPTALSFDEVLLLDLRDVRLVVLSACSTMYGRPRLSDGIASLAWAFKAAGADAVVASRWPVVDDAAPHYWEAFYEELRRSGSVPRSMLKAQREMIVHPAYGASPAVWAVYQLMA